MSLTWPVMILCQSRRHKFFLQDCLPFAENKGLCENSAVFELQLLSALWRRTLLSVRASYTQDRGFREQKPTTNLCCGHTLLMDTPPGLCQPLLQAAASAICGIALVLLLPVGEGATLQRMHAFVEKFFHHAPFLINCCFLLYSECHFSMPRMPKF